MARISKKSSNRINVESLERRQLLSGFNLTTYQSTNGQTPVGGVVVDSLGDVIGTNSASNSGTGTVWELSAASLALGNTITSTDPNNPSPPPPPTTTIVHEFTDTSGDGSIPDGDLIIDSHDNIYGTTKDGGAFGDGAIFEISGASLDAGTPDVSIIASFNNTDGLAPIGGLLLIGSTLYGTASSGGAHNSGVVFKLSASGGAITDIVSFNGLGAQGSNPQVSLVADSSGNLYGTTVSGGNGGTGDFGTVFEINPNTQQLTTLYDFTNGIDGGRPAGRLAIDSSGDLFGACSQGGGSSIDGSVWEITGNSIRSGTPSLATLHSFDGSDGIRPLAGVILDGTDIYGTTFGDHSTSYGTLFEISGNSFSTLNDFVYDANDAVQPDTDLYLAADGTIYGMTRFGNDFFTYEPSEIHVSNQNQLVFGQPPTNANVGADIAPGVTVKIENSNGDVVTSDSSSVTIAIASGPSSTLAGTLTEQAINGVATFPDLSLGTAGTYTLSASDATDNLTAAPSSSFVIASAGTPSNSAAKLVFLQQPQTSIINGPISTVQVAVEDSSGNIVSDDGSTVTLSLGKGLNNHRIGTVLGGTLSGPAIDGIATFSTLTLNFDGKFSFVASDAKLAKALSTQFSIIPILKWVQQPTLTTAGRKIAPVVTVQLVDYVGTPVLSDKTPLTLTLASGPTGGKLGATKSPVRQGIAIFPKLSLQKVGEYSLQANDGSAAPITSADFGIVPGPAKKMLFATLPLSTPAGETFEVIVQLEDAYANLATNNFTTILLTLGTKPKGAVLGGTIMRQVSSGQAIFNDLVLTKIGSYTLTATDDTATPKAIKSMLIKTV